MGEEEQRIKKSCTKRKRKRVVTLKRKTKDGILYDKKLFVKRELLKYVSSLNESEISEPFIRLQVQTRILTAIIEDCSRLERMQGLRKEAIKQLKAVAKERVSFQNKLDRKDGKDGKIIFLNECDKKAIAFLNAKDYASKRLSRKYKSLLLKASSSVTPFPGMMVVGYPGSGAQKKAKHTAFYIDENGKKWMVKMSADYPADNVAEVVTASLLVDLIGEKHAVPYEFLKAADGGMYLKSEVRKEFGTLKKDKEKALAIGSNPVTKKNKGKIHERLERFENEMAMILAGSLLVGDSDCQVGNICFYKDDSGNKKIAKFDDGWGLADLCKPGHQAVDLFEKIAWLGERGTHGVDKLLGANLPTNHYIDYPKILYSMDFVNALKKIGEDAKAKAKASEFVSKALDKIDAAYIDAAYNGNVEEHKKAYKDFADHLGVSLKNLSLVNEMREEISSELTKSIQSRGQSMILLSASLKLKIEVDHGTNPEKLKEALKEVHELAVINSLSKIEDVFPDFKNAIKPFVSETSPRAFLEKVLKKSRLDDSLKDSEEFRFFNNLLSPEPAEKIAPPDKATPGTGTPPRTPPMLLSTVRQPSSIESSEPLPLSAEKIAQVNEKIKEYAILTIPTTTKLPTFTGKNPLKALEQCGEESLKKLSYILKMPKNMTEKVAINTAKAIMAGAMGDRVTQVQIADKIYTRDEFLENKQTPTISPPSPRP